MNSMRELRWSVTRHSLESSARRVRYSLLIFLLAAVAVAYPNDQRSALAPLSKDEILATVQILKQAAKASDDSRFSLITLHEPSKQEVVDPRPGSEGNRQVFVVFY